MISQDVPGIKRYYEMNHQKIAQVVSNCMDVSGWRVYIENKTFHSRVLHPTTHSSSLVDFEVIYWTLQWIQYPCTLRQMLKF